MSATGGLQERRKRLGIGRMLTTLHDGEAELAAELARVRERHEADAGVHHLTQRFEEWSLRHADALRPHADRYGSTLPPEDDDRAFGSIAAAMRELAGKAVSRTPASGAILLCDLRRLSLLAHQVATDYAILGTAARALRDRELMATLASGQDETERLIAWLNTQLKEKAPQVLTVA